MYIYCTQLGVYFKAMLYNMYYMDISNKNAILWRIKYDSFVRLLHLQLCDSSNIYTYDHEKITCVDQLV